MYDIPLEHFLFTESLTIYRICLRMLLCKQDASYPENVARRCILNADLTGFENLSGLQTGSF
jgi:hypothetical protein